MIQYVYVSLDNFQEKKFVTAARKIMPDRRLRNSSILFPLGGWKPGNFHKFIDRDPHWYKRRVKEAIHLRLHPNNINRDNGIEIPEAWMPTIKKHNNRRTVRQRTAERTTGYRNSEDRNAPITAVKKQPITARQRAL